MIEFQNTVMISCLLINKVVLLYNIDPAFLIAISPSTTQKRHRYRAPERHFSISYTIPTKLSRFIGLPSPASLQIKIKKFEMPTVLVVGATRGLGASLVNQYASNKDTTVFGTTRKAAGPSDSKFNEKIVWVPNIDVSEDSCGRNLVNQLGSLGGGGGMVEGGVHAFDVVVSLLCACNGLSIVTSH
jgi:hypothetical protein